MKSFIKPNNKTSIPPIENNDQIYTSEHDKANIINSFFQSQSLLDDRDAPLPAILPTTLESGLNSIVITTDEVESVLKILPVGKAIGFYVLANVFFVNFLIKFLPLTIPSLTSRLILVMYLVHIKKQTYVLSLKRVIYLLFLIIDPFPYALLNSENKVSERLIFKQLYNHLRDNNILSSLQSGFIPADSTVNQLTYLYNVFFQALDSGKEVRAVFCDISKAFDRVWHVGLLLKLQAAGVTGKVLDWIKSYLSDRRQRVVIPCGTFDWTSIHAGVSQGSIFGPLLFLVY